MREGSGRTDRRRSSRRTSRGNADRRTRDAVASPGCGEPVRIARWLSRAGAASRRQAEAFILEGRVRVNGKLCDSPATRIDFSDRVELDGRPVRRAQPSRLWRYCKPVGVIVSRSDPQGRRSLPDALPVRLARTMPVGRLDAASEGLLLLTNDGSLKRHLELPASRVVRVYRARVRGTPDDTALQALRRGLVIRGERFRPMGVSVERKGASNSWLRLELSEGRYREVRRALDHVGHPVNRLRRTAYGPLQLGDLKPGESREVPERIVRRILAEIMATKGLRGARK